MKPGLCVFWGNTPNAQVRDELTHSVALRVLSALFTKGSSFFCQGQWEFGTALPPGPGGEIPPRKTQHTQRSC